jgi:hypothetical protein
MRPARFFEAPEGGLTPDDFAHLPPESRLIRLRAAWLFDFRAPSPALLEYLVEDFRLWRSVLLRRGLDPDRLTPEDALLLTEDKDGQLAQVERRNEAWRKLTC